MNKHLECEYRALSAMATNYADTLREVRLDVTDVTMDMMQVPTIEAAREMYDGSYCDCADRK